MQTFTTLFILLISYSISAQPQLPDFDARYTLNVNGAQAGMLKQSLTTQTNGLRLFRSETKATGLFALIKPEIIIETSLWSQLGQLIQPQRYHYQRRGGRKAKSLSLRFDWSLKRVYIDDKKQPWSIAIDGPVYDKLLYQLVLMKDLKQHQQSFQYRIADGGKLKQYTINVVGEEIISTSLGDIKTLKLIRVRNSSSERKTTLWSAPSLDFLPIRLEHTEKNGIIFTATLHQISGIKVAKTSSH